MRNAASATYTAVAGEVWTPWRGSVGGTRATAALIEARDALRAAKARKYSAADPGAVIVAFRGSPKADTGIDAGRIFDALNWAYSQWPDMALATTGAPGAEKLAIKWAAQKQVALAHSLDAACQEGSQPFGPVRFAGRGFALAGKGPTC